jgi:hypothetical protein
VYVICAFCPASPSLAATTNTVVLIGASSNTDAEYRVFSNSGAKLLASVTLIYRVASSKTVGKVCEIESIN